MLFSGLGPTLRHAYSTIIAQIYVKRAFIKELLGQGQSWTKYLRQTLVFM